jgi:hypothetical protein
VQRYTGPSKERFSLGGTSVREREREGGRITSKIIFLACLCNKHGLARFRECVLSKWRTREMTFIKTGMKAGTPEVILFNNVKTCAQELMKLIQTSIFLDMILKSSRTARKTIIIIKSAYFIPANLKFEISEYNASKMKFPWFHY